MNDVIRLAVPQPLFDQIRRMAECQAYEHGVTDVDFSLAVPFNGYKIVPTNKAATSRTSPEHAADYWRDKAEDLAHENAYLVFWLRILGFLAISLGAMRIATWLL